ncbi:MAG: hypothetical protein M1824_003336 [Vezdaea acicularis]|nr:MAG: hypothetical protein M1824_003336 [Vezdaea acicularis]
MHISTRLFRARLVLAPLEETRLQKLLHDARRWVRRLEHANAGCIKPLMDVLLLAYGRKGPRRHEFLRQLRKPNIPSSSAETEALRDNLNSLKGEAAPSAVSVLVKSQHKRQNMATDRSPIKSLKPKIPETNAWGRPLPRVRYKNQVRKHEKMLLDRILPPLPEHEWTRLQALAWGIEADTKPVGKRSNSSGSIAERLPTGGGRTRPSVSDERPHRITARFMRRLWGKVLVQCPLMKFDFNTRRWTLTWSPAHSPAKDRQIKTKKETALGSSGITNCNLALFSGVDQRGRLVATNT